MTTNSWKVTSRINGYIDLVYISSEGNIACTSPSYARWGLPSIHILAGFEDGNICINLKQQFHPVYHFKYINDINDDAIADYTVMSDVPNSVVKFTSVTTKWNWAQQTSWEKWKTIGLGGDAYGAVAYPTAKSISQAPESIAVCYSSVRVERVETLAL
jgi:hypothetical protein